MGKIMRNGVPYCVGDDDAFRYVNDVTDENYGWIQYQLEDGNWVNYEQVDSLIYPLYMSSANEGGFEAYAGSVTNYDSSYTLTPTLAFGEVMTVSTTTSSNDLKYGCAVSKSIDLTDYTKVKFHYVATKQQSVSNYFRFFITETKALNMEMATSLTLLAGGSSELTKEEDVEIDISALSGKHYIVFEIGTKGSTNSLKVSNMYLE